MLVKGAWFIQKKQTVDLPFNKNPTLDPKKIYDLLLANSLTSHIKSKFIYTHVKKHSTPLFFWKKSFTLLELYFNIKPSGFH